jgi:hypothetical protein
VLRSNNRALRHCTLNNHNDGISLHRCHSSSGFQSLDAHSSSWYASITGDRSILASLSLSTVTGSFAEIATLSCSLNRQFPVKNLLNSVYGRNYSNCKAVTAFPTVHGTIDSVWLGSDEWFTISQYHCIIRVPRCWKRLDRL